MEYRFQEDILLVQEITGQSRRELASKIGVGAATLERWVQGDVQPSQQRLALFYDYAFSHGVPLNRIKAQLRTEELAKTECRLLFHGSKSGIDGPLSLAPSRANNDFGRGFYCGENLEQSAMFVNQYPTSSIYMVAFAPAGLQGAHFVVVQDWMLAVSAFRGRLKDYEGHPKMQELMRRVSEADYVVAPIADNRMFEIMDDFSQGFITDEQCQHALSATGLGMQWVITSEQALKQTTLLEKCYLSAEERGYYERKRKEELEVGLAKVKAAHRQYRGRGRYVDELLGEEDR